MGGAARPGRQGGQDHAAFCLYLQRFPVRRRSGLGRQRHSRRAAALPARGTALCSSRWLVCRPESGMGAAGLFRRQCQHDEDRTLCPAGRQGGLRFRHGGEAVRRRPQPAEPDLHLQCQHHDGGAGRRGVVQPRRRPRRLCRHRGPVVAVEAILPATPERSIPLRGLALASLLHAGVAGAAVLLDYPAEPEVPVLEIAYVLLEPALVPQAPEPAERTAAAPPPPAAAEPEPPPEPLPPAQSEPEPEPVPDAPAAIAAPPPRPAAKPHRPQPAAAPAPAPPQ